MRRYLYLLVWLTLLGSGVSAYAASKSEECLSPSEYAQQQLKRIIQVVPGADKVHFCRSDQSLHARGMLKKVGEVPHPYISWKKVPVLEPFVFYNAELLNQMDATTDNRFTSIAIIAHQVGAVLAQAQEIDKSEQQTYPANVEPADYYAGYVLARLHATTRDLKTSQRALFSVWNEMHNEVTQRRMESAVQGWAEGGGEQLAVDDLLNISPTLYGEVDKW